MGNLGGGEILVIMLLALIVLGPQRLPDAAKQIGKFMGEVRRVSNGFQRELRTAMDDTTEQAARAKGARYVPTDAAAPALAPVEQAGPGPGDDAAPARRPPAKKAPARKRSAPLRAAGRSGNGSAP